MIAYGAIAIVRRRQWLVNQGLGTINATNTFQPQPRMLEQLRQRDLRQASQILSNELGLAHAQLVEGEKISGTFNRSVDLASGKYAVILKSKEFTLVPWRPELEQFRGKLLSGTAGSQGITWDWNTKRGQGLGLSYTEDKVTYNDAIASCQFLVLQVFRTISPLLPILH